MAKSEPESTNESVRTRSSYITEARPWSQVWGWALKASSQNKDMESPPCGATTDSIARDVKGWWNVIWMAAEGGYFNGPTPLVMESGSNNLLVYTDVHIWNDLN